MRLRMLIASSVVLALSGCGSASAPASKSSPRPSSSTTTADPSTPTTTTPTPSAASDQYSQIGQTWQANGYTVRVLQIRENAPSAAPADSGRWDAALAKICNVNASPLKPSWSTWELFDKNSGEYPAASETYNGMLRPEYPFFGDQSFAGGRCAQGWIYFDMSKSTHAIGAAYVAEDGTAHLWVKRGLLPS